MEIGKFLTHRSELVAGLGGSGEGLPMLDFTNTLCSIVLHQALPDACPLMSTEREVSKTIKEGMLTCC